MKKLSWLLTAVVISVFFFQCQKDISFIGGPDTGSSVAPSPINTSVQGNITDENDQPAAGVVVTAGTSLATTDADGYFHITNAVLDKNTTLVRAVKDGYFTGYRVFGATSGNNQVAIKLIKKDLAGTVAASSGGEALLSNGAKVSLPAGGVVVASSNAGYTGDVKVYTSYINPKSADIGKTVPGSFAANDKNGKRVVLSSFGMLAVELSSSTGEKLQIKTGSAATLTIPIPASSVASAPATLPLWYIDETTGIWKEEGTATKQGSNYVGTVKHFSFWNCDYPYDAVNLSVTLQTPDGLPLVNAAVRVSGFTSDTSTYVASTYGYTDSLGQVKGLVPANTSLTLDVLGACGGTVVYSQSISPLSQDKDLGTVKITDVTSSLLTLTGTIVNCDNAPVANGYAIITLNGMKRYTATDANGKFTTTYVTCAATNANIFISGVDAGAQQQSTETEMTVTLPLADVGTITACGNRVDEQYINYTIDGINYSLTSANGDSLAGYQVTTDKAKFFGFKYPPVSNYIGFTAYTYAINSSLPMNALSLRDGDTVQRSPSTITFTLLPDSVNRYYEGSFSGTYLDSNISHTISATFKIKQ